MCTFLIEIALKALVLSKKAPHCETDFNDSLIP